MASGSIRSSSSSWTPRQNKQFEEALVYFDKDSPDRWHNMARAVGKLADEVKRHYKILVKDIMQIESDQVQLPNYRSSGRRLMENLKLNGGENFQLYVQCLKWVFGPLPITPS